MNVVCTICSDMFSPTNEVYTTQCGHMFHLACLMNWMERSKTCPQCRHKCTETTIHRVYFNLPNTDGITEDIGTLMIRLENAQFQVSLKEKDVRNYIDKYKKAKHQSTVLREEVTELESKVRVHESAIHALKDQVSYFKSKARETDRLSEEVGILKNRIKNMENVELAINGTREQVNEMLRNENNAESLAILASTLKKTLLDAEKKKRDMEYNLKKAHNDVTRYRREVNTLQCENNELRKEAQYIKDNLEKEKQYLKNKIAELNKKISEGNVDVANTSLKRIISESPVNFSRTTQSSSGGGCLNETDSPLVAEKVKKIMESDSPYLPVKSSNVAIDYTSIMNSKSKIGNSSGFSIFKTAPKTVDSLRPTKPKSDVIYNGLGGSSKEDIFPTPRPSQTGMKRHKSGSSISSSKFRKLAPSAGKTKVTDFFSQSGSQ